MEEITKNDTLKIVIAINDELEQLEKDLDVIDKEILLLDDNLDDYSDRIFEYLLQKDNLEQNIYQYKEILKKLGV